MQTPELGNKEVQQHKSNLQMKDKSASIEDIIEAAYDPRALNLSTLRRALKRSPKTNYAIVGAHARNIHTLVPRGTKDIDLVAEHPDQFHRILRKHFPTLKRKNEGDAYRYSDAITGKPMIEVLKPVFPFHGALHKPVVRKGLMVANVTSLIAMKMHAHYADPMARHLEDREQDLADVGSLMSVYVRKKGTLKRLLKACYPSHHPHVTRIYDAYKAEINQSTRTRRNSNKTG